MLVDRAVPFGKAIGKELVHEGVVEVILTSTRSTEIRCGALDGYRRNGSGKAKGGPKNLLNNKQALKKSFSYYTISKDVAIRGSRVIF